MPIVTSPAFRRAVLTWSLPIVNTYWYRLYTNDYTPLYTSTAADFVEPAGSWYRAKQVASWGTPANLASGYAEISADVQTWIAAGTVVNESVWGYWVTTASGLYVWGERKAGLIPFPMNLAGKKITLLPRLDAGVLC